MPAHLRFAAAAGVRLTTFDTAHELQKIAAVHPETGAVRIHMLFSMNLAKWLQDCRTCSPCAALSNIALVRRRTLLRADICMRRCRRAAAHTG